MAIYISIDIHDRWRENYSENGYFLSEIAVSKRTDEIYHMALVIVLYHEKIDVAHIHTNDMGSMNLAVLTLAVDF
jgi:hypothetical protein